MGYKIVLPFKQSLLNGVSSGGKFVDDWSIQSNRGMNNTTRAFTIVNDEEIILGILNSMDWEYEKYFYVAWNGGSEQFKTLGEAVKFIESKFKTTVTTNVQEALLSTFTFELSNGFD